MHNTENLGNNLGTSTTDKMSVGFLLCNTEHQLLMINALRPPTTSVLDNYVGGHHVRYFENSQSYAGSFYRYVNSGIEDDHLPFMIRGTLLAAIVDRRNVMRLVGYPR